MTDSGSAGWLTAAKRYGPFVAVLVLFETYGRRVEVEFYTGTGESDDQDAARADALAIADMEPFAVVGAPLQAGEVFADTLAEEGVVCAP